MNIVNKTDENNELDAGTNSCLSFHSKNKRSCGKYFGQARGPSIAARLKGKIRMIPFKLDYVIERTLKGQTCEEQKLLREFAGVKLSPSEARAEWPRVLEHKWFVSERLGRDTGLRVAAIDYFENVRLPRHKRTTHKSQNPWLRCLTQTHSVVA